MQHRLRRYAQRFGWRKALEIYLKTKLPTSELAFKLPGLRAPLRMRHGRPDRRTFEKIFVEREYQVALAEQPRVIIDGGANIGFASVYFAARFPEATILAIEPESDNFRLLELNTRPYANIRCLQRALWSHDTRVVIENPDADPVSYRMREDSRSAGTVDAISIGTALKTLGSDHLDLLKLDIEGAEKVLFESEDCDDWLSRTGALLIELHERFKPGTQQAFDRAVARHPFRRFESGENIVLVRGQLPA